MNQESNLLRIPAHTRLRSLPPVFDLRDVSMVFGWDSGLTRLFCARATSRELLRKAGPKTGIYYNLVVDPKGPERRLGEALRKFMPSGVIIGSSALHAGEWTTQRSHLLEVAMPKTRGFRTCPQFDGANIVFRDRRWYASVASAFTSDPLQRSLKVLSPEAALADAWINRDVWDPDPDDIQIEDDRDLDRLRHWLTKLGMDDYEIEARIDALQDMQWGGLGSGSGESSDFDWDDEGLERERGMAP